MSVVITKEDLKAYTEVDYIINHMNEKYIAMLPKNLLNFFDTIKDPDYEVYVNPYKPLQDQGLTKYALEIIALLHVRFWCEDQKRKEELLEKMRDNQEKFEAQLKEQFSVDKIFDNTNKVSKEDPLVSAYSKYTETNPDIHDYTDLREETNTKSDLPDPINKKISIFGKIKLFFTKKLFIK